MPYGFYNLVRFIALIGCGILAFKANRKNKNTEMIIFGALALLFQPFFKVTLGREIWNVLDVIIGVGLIINTLISRSKDNRKD